MDLEELKQELVSDEEEELQFHEESRSPEPTYEELEIKPGIERIVYPRRTGPRPDSDPDYEEPQTSRSPRKKTNTLRRKYTLGPRWTPRGPARRRPGRPRKNADEEEGDITEFQTTTCKICATVFYSLQNYHAHLATHKEKQTLFPPVRNRLSVSKKEEVEEEQERVAMILRTFGRVPVGRILNRIPNSYDFELDRLQSRIENAYAFPAKQTELRELVVPESVVDNFQPDAEFPSPWFEQLSGKNIQFALPTKKLIAPSPKEPQIEQRKVGGKILLTRKRTSNDTYRLGSNGNSSRKPSIISEQSLTGDIIFSHKLLRFAHPSRPDKLYSCSDCGLEFDQLWKCGAHRMLSHLCCQPKTLLNRLGPLRDQETTEFNRIELITCIKQLMTLCGDTNSPVTDDERIEIESKLNLTFKKGEERITRIIADALKRTEQLERVDHPTPSGNLAKSRFVSYPKSRYGSHEFYRGIPQNYNGWGSSLPSTSSDPTSLVTREMEIPFDSSSKINDSQTSFKPTIVVKKTLAETGQSSAPVKYVATNERKNYVVINPPKHSPSTTTSGKKPVILNFKNLNPGTSPKLAVASSATRPESDLNSIIRPNITVGSKSLLESLQKSSHIDQAGVGKYPFLKTVKNIPGNSISSRLPSAPKLIRVIRRTQPQPAAPLSTIASELQSVFPSAPAEKQIKLESSSSLAVSITEEPETSSLEKLKLATDF